MFSLRDLRFVLCSRDLDVRPYAFFLHYSQMNEAGKCDHMIVTVTVTVVVTIDGLQSTLENQMTKTWRPCWMN